MARRDMTRFGAVQSVGELGQGLFASMSHAETSRGCPASVYNKYNANGDGGKVFNR